MSQCRGRKKDGTRCRKIVRGDSHYCAIHADQEKKPGKWPIALGVVAGHLAASGVGGWLVGGLIGSAFVEEKKMSKTRVFVSFDYDHDVSLKHLLVGQSKYEDSPFEIERRRKVRHIFCYRGTRMEHPGSPAQPNHPIKYTNGHG